MSCFDYYKIGNLSDFTLKKYLGQGAYGKVQLYVYNNTNQEYAIKLVSKQLVEEYGINIDEEVNIMKDLNHVNLLKVYRRINTDHEYGIILEYCEDGDLKSLIKKKNKLSEKESLVVLYQLLNGIKYLHEKDYLHRDLKPANILITKGISNPIVKITDFGFSRNMNGASMASTRAGTPLYMSPEILEGERYDARADVWSIGCLFYEMLEGTVPYDASTETQLYKKILKEKLKIPDGLTNISVQLLLKSLDIDVNSRATISELYNLVLNYVGKEIEEMKKKENEDKKDEEYLISKEYDNEILIEYYKLKLKENVIDEEMLLKLGMLYEEKMDYVSMKKYYFQLERLGNEEVKLRLGRYYLEVENDYDMAKKYNVHIDEPTNKLNEFESKLGVNNVNSTTKVNDTSDVNGPINNFDELLKLGDEQRDLKDYKEMKKYYLMAIEFKNSTAMYNLANYYYNIVIDYEMAKKYYLMAIELNHSGAMTCLAYYYYDIIKDYEMAKKYYLMAIELNNPDAMNGLAVYYHLIVKDYEMAKKYYIMAIELKNSDAMNNLANYYCKFTQDNEIVKKYYLMAIELKNSDTKNGLDVYYCDYNMAKKYYLMAIELNHSGAMYNLALYYYDIAKDYEMAKKFYLMAIELKNSFAMNGLAVYYHLIEKDYEMAKKYYLMAIELKNSYAMYNLANYYCQFTQNYDIAKKYYLMAIELKNSDAMTCLAYYYYDIEKDYEMAKKYYLMAIELKNSYAMYNLANYYRDIVRDYNMAMKYYLMAIELKNSHAMYNLANYYFIIKDYDMATKYYLMAIELKNSYAMNNLANYYRDIVRDYDMAMKYYLMAIELNNPDAKFNLEKLKERRNYYI